MKKIILISITIILLISSILLYSHFIGTKGLNTNEYKVTYKELNDDFYGFKIIHFSDLLYGSTIDENDLKTIVKKINLSKPDIVFFTGDLISKNYILTAKDKNKIIKYLNKIEASIGKYQIKGDNDSNETLDILNKSGFIDLNDKTDLIYKNNNSYIAIMGISSNYKKNKIKEKYNQLLESIDKENKPNYTILLMHEADLINDIDIKDINLILAGHNLNGQIRLPFIGGIIKNKYGSIYTESYYKKNKTNIYISGGIGVNNYKFRLFNHPSINLYRITK